MRIAVVVVAAATLAVAAWVQSISHDVGELAKSVEALSSKVNAKPTPSAGLESQGKCAEQARKVFVERGLSKELIADYENHFNSVLNKCFVHLRETDTESSPGLVVLSWSLVDAFEGRMYGRFFWRSQKGKKNWEVPPLECNVEVPGGERKACKSAEEFDELLKTYMAEGR